MNMDFSIREAILSATQSWPLVLAFGIMGVLLGLVAAFIWPSYHQATKALHVGLNVYQISEEPGVPGIANPQFIYADDYKNWQMATLNNVIFMDSILEGALSQLRSQDEYWTQIKREQFTGMLKVNWRNAGKWNLVAEHPQADFAAQAVTAWENSIIEKTHIAIGSARESLMLDLEIRALMNTQVQATTRLATLEEQLAGLESWRLIIDALPPDQPVDEDTTPRDSTSLQQRQ